MPAVTPPPPTPPPVNQPTTTTPPASTPLQATLTAAPDKIQDLSHTIQVVGTLTDLPGDQVTLTTSLGEMTILLPAIAQEVGDQLTQQLTSLLQSGKPVTLSIQPGNPPTSATLLLPPAVATQAEPVAETITGQAVQQTAQTLGAAIQPGQGTVLEAIVLPSALPPLNEAATVPSSAYLNAQNAFPDMTGLMQEELLLTVDGKAETALSAEADTALNLAAATGAPLSLPPNSASASPAAATGATPQTLPPNLATAETVFTSAAGNAIPTAAAGALPASTAVPSLTLPSTTDTAANNAAQTQPATVLTNAQVLAAATQTAELEGVPVTVSNLEAPTTATLLQAGASVTLTVSAIAPPGAPPPVATSSNQIVAVVSDNGPQGQLLLTSDNSSFFVPKNVNAPPGTSLLITVDQGTLPRLLPLLRSDESTTASLNEMVAALNQVNAGIAQQMLQNLMPQPGESLSGAMLFFMSALGEGNFRSWIGPSASDLLLKSGKAELIARLTEQLAGGAETVRDAVVGEWRSYPVPIRTDNQFQLLHFYVHRDPNQQNKGQGSSRGSKAPGGAVRFLIDVRLSRLGAMQLDGFVRPKQLDMMFRSEKLLPPGLDRELRDAYAQALDAVGFKGAIQFQTGRRTWVQIQQSVHGSLVT